MESLSKGRLVKSFTAIRDKSCLCVRSMLPFYSWWHECFQNMSSLIPLLSIAVGAVTKEGPQDRESEHSTVSGGQWEETALPLNTLMAQCAHGKNLGTSSIQAMLPRALLQTFSESKTSMQHTGEDRDAALYWMNEPRGFAPQLGYKTSFWK